YWAVRYLNKPYVFSPVGSLPIFGRSKILKTAYNYIIGQALVSHATGYVAVTQKEVLDFLPYGVDPKRVKVIPNGIRTELLFFEDKEEFLSKIGSPRGKIFLYIGRLNPIKGPDLLIDAFIQAQSTLNPTLDKDVLVIAGPDEGMGAELKSKVAQAGLTSRVYFVGYLDARAKSQAYHACDVLVIPSRSEAMSIVAVEGGFCGLPVLLTNTCGFDIVDEVGGGKTVPPTVEGILEGLLFMKSHEAELPEIGRRLKERVTCDFTWDHVTDELVHYIEKEILSS
ncbi:MAG: glycosyltransferase, partial [Deltaproteobacteria bacterium]|nr:glycosyltransferase [Deltaproteobacteria bacterium]